MTITLVREMSPARLPEWLYPPEGREWTVDDLDNLPPEAPRRLEIIDGALIVMSPAQAFYHSSAISSILLGLRAQAPGHLMVMSECTVALPDGDAPVPDVAVFERHAYRGPRQSRVDGEHVALAIEVVSPDSHKRDRIRKPQLYADVGIEHYWIIDLENDITVTQRYRRDSGGSYQLTEEHRDQVTCAEPFPIELDLSTKALGL